MLYASENKTLLGTMGTTRIAVLVITTDALIGLPTASRGVVYAVGHRKTVSCAPAKKLPLTPQI